MASDYSIRASDVDREVVVATLRDAYTAGRLTLEEFDERTTAALPAHPERSNGNIPPVRHRPRAIAFLPIVTLWLVLALASRSAHDVVAPTVVLVMTIALLSFGRRRLNCAGL